MSTRELAAFLFTDVVGSTAMWEADEPRMSAAMRDHDEMARNIVARAGGEVFKELGDGICASFVSVADAIAAAVELQRALRAAEGSVSVRAGIHAGEAERRDGDWFGPPLNRCARIMGVAHGGQILVSSGAAQLAEGRLPADVGLLELPPVRLRGLVDAVHLLQVRAEGLGAEFPPVVGETSTNLPATRTAFIGRDEDVKVVARLVRDARVVTLAGVGGTGKTRLAVEVGRTMLGEIPDGVFFAALAEVGDTEGVARVCSEAAGLVAGGSLGGGSPDYRALLLGGLAARESLLIIDNCEHLLDEVAEIVDDVLDGCAQVRIVCTSREPIGVDGERVWRVPALAEADAVALFEDRARASSSNLLLSDADRDLAMELCRRLDGLPLAIELAAARMRAMSISDIAGRLDDRFRLLAGRGRARERHATLRATLDWSYDLLDEDERVLLDRLSVFVGTFPLAGAEEVCGIEPLDAADVLDLLTGLVDKSLVTVMDHGASVRYRLLETLQAYAGDKLGARSEIELLRNRHARWMYHTAIEHWTESTAMRRALQGPINPVVDEADNARAAVDWALAARDPNIAMLVACTLAAGWLTRGNAPEAAKLCEAALGLDGGEEWIRHVTLVQFAQSLQWCSDSRVWDAMARALEALEEMGDRSPDPPLSHAFTWQLVGTVTCFAHTPPGGGPGPERCFEEVRVAQRPLRMGSYADFLEGIWLLVTGRAPEALQKLGGDLDTSELNAQWKTYLSKFHALALYLAEGDAALVPAAVVDADDSGDPTNQRDAALLEALVAEPGSDRVRDALARSLRIAREFSYPIRSWINGAASIVMHHGDVSTAARLWGAVGDYQGWHMPETLAVTYRPRARQALGAARFDELAAEGAGMSMDEATELALASV